MPGSALGRAGVCVCVDVGVGVGGPEDLDSCSALPSRPESTSVAIFLEIRFDSTRLPEMLDCLRLRILGSGVALPGVDDN